MYRKIPLDLMDGTRRGSALSYLSVGAMLILFLLESKAYFSKTYALVLVCVYQSLNDL